MKLSNFIYELPENLVAEYPNKNRDESRLMVIDRSDYSIQHRLFKDMIDYFNEDDVIVLNNTKVFPAKLYATKDRTDAKVEIFLLRELGDRLWEVFQLKRHNPNIIVLHRVDGPISIVRNNPEQLIVDKSIMLFNERFADGTIFQSEWSLSQCLSQGMDDKKPQVVIHNAPDPNIFFPPKVGLVPIYEIPLYTFFS